MTDHTFRSTVKLVQNKDDEREREEDENDDEKNEEEGLMPQPKYVVYTNDGSFNF